MDYDDLIKGCTTVTECELCMMALEDHHSNGYIEKEDLERVRKIKELRCAQILSNMTSEVRH